MTVKELKEFISKYNDDVEIEGIDVAGERVCVTVFESVDDQDKETIVISLD